MLPRIKSWFDFGFLTMVSYIVCALARFSQWRIQRSEEEKEDSATRLFRAAAAGDRMLFSVALNEVLQEDPAELPKTMSGRDGNGWTLFQLAAGNGHVAILEQLVSVAKSADLQNERHNNRVNEDDNELRDKSGLCQKLLNDGGVSGHAPVILALVNRHEGAAQLLIREGAALNDSKLRGRNPAYLTGLGGMWDAAQSIIAKHGEQAFAKMANETDDNGYNALYAAALGGNAELCNLLLDMGVPIKQGSPDGSSAIHAACRGLPQRDGAATRSDTAAIDALLAKASVEHITSCDNFGSTPLHLAAACANVGAVQSIVAHFGIEELTAQDNDGLHPLHSAVNELCRCAEALSHENDDAKKDKLESRLKDALQCALVLLQRGYPLDARDYADATAMHILCHRPTSFQLDAAISICSFLRESGAYPQERIHAVLEAQDCHGWTCLHQAFQTNGVCGRQLFFLLSSHVSGGFLAGLNPSQPKQDSDAFHQRRGAHNRIPLATRRAVLDGAHSPEGVAQRLLSLPHTPRVTVVIGAGVSTSVGIKDFRSSTGLYSSQATARLFSESAILSDPEAFYAMVGDVFLPVVDGTVRPSQAHVLLRLLKEKGWLQRVFTQNVDMLEHDLLDAADVVECHGSFKTARCTNHECPFRVESQQDMQRLFWEPIRALKLRDGSGSCDAGTSNKIPTCLQCSSPLRPDVTFFGERLPPRFHAACKEDLPRSDLILVMGTSLMVYPVASLPQLVGPECVRVLVNREPTGCFQHCPPCDVRAEQTTDAAKPAEAEGGAQGDRGAGSGFRDVFLRGACDDGARALAKALGWEKELPQQCLVRGATAH